jgi:SET domain-containing protein
LARICVAVSPRRSSNCFVLMNTDSKDRLVYMARKPIKKGEEITFHYYGLPGTKSEMWFKKKE